MFKIEFVASPVDDAAPVLHSELALTKSLEEAKDFADTHLAGARSKYGAGGYRIRNESAVRVAVGPEGFVGGR